MRFDRSFHGNRRAVRAIATFLTVTAAALLLSTATSVGALEAGDGIAAGCEAEGVYTSDPLQHGDLGPVTRSTDPADVELDATVIVSPPLIDVDEPLAAGDSFVCTLTVRNRHSEAATFEITPLGMVGSRAGNAGIEFIDASDERWEQTAGSWITPAVDSITLEPREVARIPFRVIVPKDPPVGSAYASLDVVSRAVARAGETTIPIESHLATQLLLRIGGDGAPKLSLHDVDAPKLRWDRDSWKLTGSLDNDGTLHANTSGRVRIRSLLGNDVATLDVRPATVLPGGRVAIAATWDGVPWLGLYQYDLRMTSDGDAASVATTEGWFVALPPWWQLAIFVAIFSTLLVRRVRAGRGRWEDEHDDDDDDPSSGGDYDFDLAERQLRG
jgi:hypothetical protein